MAETKGLKCNPVAGLGSNIPALRQREDLFVTQHEREYGIQADSVTGGLYDYDTISNLVNQQTIDMFKKAGLKYRKGWGTIGNAGSVRQYMISNQDIKNKIYSHSHPTNSSFSDQDIISLLSTGIIESRAVTDFYIHIAQRPSDYEKYTTVVNGGLINQSSIQKSNQNKVASRMNYWKNKLITTNPEKKYYTEYGSYEEDPILKKYLNPDLVNDKIYMGQYNGLHYGFWVELHHLVVETALAEFNIPYSRVRRTTNQEFNNNIKDDKPREDIVDDTKKRQISEKPVNQRIITQPQTNRIITPKSTRKDIRGDLFPINPRDRGDLRIKRRNPYPWEDKEYFEKLRKEAEAKKDELDNNPNKQIVTETENPLQKRKAKTKGTKDMVEIVKPSKFEWVPRGKRAIGYGGDYDRYSNPISPLDTKNGNSSSEILSRQKLVMDLLKKEGFSQIIVAGMMGNIHKETGGTFNPMALNGRDTNGYPSVGIFQWNGQYNGNTTDAEKVWNLIGRTIPDQINYTLTRWSNFRVFKTKMHEARNADHAAYLFAKYGEICAYCNEGPRVYYSPSKFMQSDRSRYAIDYYRRFNDSSDQLYWGSSE